MSLVRICFSVILLFGNGSGVAQNLIQNAGFESYINCPEQLGNLSLDCKGLKAPTLGSTDYFNSCGASQLGVPVNFNGIQEPFEGKAYGGLYLHSANEYREYIQFKLKQPLQHGEEYRVSMRLSLAERSSVAMQEVTVLFTPELLEIPTNENLSPRRLHRFGCKDYTYVELNVTKNILNNTAWAFVETTYTAKGGEQFMIFGNFKSDKYSKIVRLTKTASKSQDFSYYYIDDVQLVKGLDKMFPLNEPFVLPQLQFDFDDDRLTAESKKEVEKVYHFLKKHTRLQLYIAGHTDDLGGNLYNQKLSSRRAKSVSQYLQTLGVKRSRMRYEGKGGMLPLVKDTTEQARYTNRRVEFVITQFEDY